MSSPPSSGPEKFAGKVFVFFGHLGAHLGTFWQRVTEGIEIQALWAQFMAEARASYSLYTREVDWAALEPDASPKPPARCSGRCC
jgi:hypothetical protein